MIYEFDRYVRGQKMAEGGRITKAKTEEEAFEMVRKMFAVDAWPDEMSQTMFILRETRQS